MTITATQLNIHPDTARAIRKGHFLRFDALGRFLEVTDRLYNGLGTIYQANGDGTFSRYHF